MLCAFKLCLYWEENLLVFIYLYDGELQCLARVLHLKNMKNILAKFHPDPSILKWWKLGPQEQEEQEHNRT